MQRVEVYGETVEKELVRMIEKRARREHNPEEMAWKSSVKRYNALRRKEIAALWFAHFSRMAANHARISEDYERRAEELCKEG
jgi:hypothetical protein